MNPDTSTNEKPIKAHRIKTLDITGFRHIENINTLKTNPTPIATPAKEIKGILLAKYLKPSKIITQNKKGKEKRSD